MKRLIFAATAAVVALSLPAIGQVALRPTAAPAQIAAGVYSVDVHHTQVLWTVNHLGITPLFGAFGASGGSLVIDPDQLAAARVTVEFRIADVSTTSRGFTRHLLNTDLFNAEAFPTARFVSTSVVPNGNQATVTGNLTIKGVTKPIVLNATFFGAGRSPISGKPNIGFTATGTLKRSEFGLSYFHPDVLDEVDLKINAGFELNG